MSNVDKPARRPRRPVAEGGEPKPARERKPRASGDFNVELRALADKHRKRSSKLRAEVAKLEERLAVKRAALDLADEPLRKIERVLADRPELPGMSDAPADQTAEVPASEEAAE